jgi:hypothetical protein
VHGLVEHNHLAVGKVGGAVGAAVADGMLAVAAVRMVGQMVVVHSPFEEGKPSQLVLR